MPQDAKIKKDIQRIGEIVIAGPSIALQEKFISAVCPEIVKTSNDTFFGRVRITDELFLFLYGIGTSDLKRGAFAWELIAKKMLGIIILFDWPSKGSFAAAQKLVDEFSQKFSASIIVAGDIEAFPADIQVKAYQPGFSLQPNVTCTLWNSSNKYSAHAVIRVLIDSIMRSL